MIRAVEYIQDTPEFRSLSATILAGLVQNGSYVGCEDKAVELTHRLLRAIEKDKTK